MAQQRKARCRGHEAQRTSRAARGRKTRNVYWSQGRRWRRVSNASPWLKEKRPRFQFKCQRPEMIANHLINRLGNRKFTYQSWESCGVNPNSATRSPSHARQCCLPWPPCLIHTTRSYFQRRTRACSLCHWFHRLAAIFVPAIGREDNGSLLACGSSH